jgi:hypothetical protein
MGDELTTKMHQEFKVSPEIDLAHRVGTVIMAVDNGIYTLAEALDRYRVTRKQYNHFSQRYK